MSLTSMVITMIIVLLALIIWNRIPIPIVMMTVPFVFALICGYGMDNVIRIVETQFQTTMDTIGYMLLFSLIYFQMLTETGMFEQIIQVILQIIGDKMNVVTVFVLTTVIALIVGLTTNIVAIYLIVFPVTIPLYKKFGINRIAAVILVQTASCVLAFLPWNYNLTLGVASTGCDLNDLSAAALPWGMCLIPVVVLQWMYFAARHKKEHGTLGLGQRKETESVKEAENGDLNARPQLIWINAVIFVIVIMALTVSLLPSWFVFCAAAFITTIINYRKEYGAIWNKCAAPFLNILTMLLAVSAYIAVFNHVPENGKSMAEEVAFWLVSVVPGSMMRFSAVICLLVLVLLVRVVPYQILVAMYPMLVSIGATFGISAVSIVAPLSAYIGLGTGVSPMTASTYVSSALSEVDVRELGTRGVGIMFVSVLAAAAVAAGFGILPI